MSTRAIQSELLLAGMVDPVTGETLAGGTVEFRSAGTTNFKNGWEDKDKTAPITSVELDDQGQAQVYFDGIYKFTVKNAAGTVRDTLDNLKYQARNTLTTTKVADYQCTAEDDFILADTSGGAITITLFAVAGVVAPISVKNIGASSNDVTVDGSGSEVIDGSLTQTLTDGAAQQYVTDGVKWYGAGAASGTVYTSSTLVSGTNNTFDVGSGITTINVLDASTTAKGVSERATDAEAIAKVDTERHITPAQLAIVPATKVVSATQAQQETGTDTETAVTPSVQHDHQSACKAWVHFTGQVGPVTNASYNVSSVVRDATGQHTVNFSTPFSSASYASVAGTDARSVSGALQVAGSIRISTYNSAGILTDAENHLTCFGDQ